MPIDIKTHRVFIASPGGLEIERKAFRESLEEFNRMDSMHRGLQFVPVGWEDTLETAGRPQELINADVRASDYFFLVIWDRWGSSPTKVRGRFTSGSEEEYDVAKDALRDMQLPLKQIVILFKGVAARQLCDPGAQLRRVLKFRRSIERDKEFIFHHFDTQEEFERIVRRFLAKWTRDHEQERAEASASAPTGITSQDLPAAADKEQSFTTEEEVTRAKAAVLGHSAPAMIEYAMLLMRAGRTARARRTLERAVRVLATRSDRQARLALEAAIQALNASMRPVEYAAVTEDIISGLSSDAPLYIQKYLAQIEASTWCPNGPFASGSETMDKKAKGVEAIASVANELREIGYGLYASGLLTLSAEIFLQCLALAHSVKLPFHIVQNYTDLCIVSAQKRDYYSARDFARRAVDAAPSGMDDVRAIARLNLGHVLVELEAFDEARELLEEAREYWGDVARGKTTSVDVDPPLGEVQIRGFEDRRHQLLRDWEPHDYWAAAHAGLGLVHLYRGETAEAEKFHMEAHLRVGHYSAISYMIDNNLGVIYQNTGNRNDALYHYGYALSETRGIMVEAQILHNRLRTLSTRERDIREVTRARALLKLTNRLAMARSEVERTEL
jgi:tetratricopeptide (TPR) repeat protein